MICKYIDNMISYDIIRYHKISQELKLKHQPSVSGVQDLNHGNCSVQLAGIPGQQIYSSLPMDTDVKLIVKPCLFHVKKLGFMDVHPQSYGKNGLDPSQYSY